MSAGGTLHSDWPPRSLDLDLNARIDRWPAFKERSIASSQAQVVTNTELLQLLTVTSSNETGFGRVGRHLYYCFKLNDVICVYFG